MESNEQVVCEAPMFSAKLLAEIILKTFQHEGMGVEVVLNNPDGTSLPLLLKVKKLSISGASFKLHVTDPY